jgi:hypothetical protein
VAPARAASWTAKLPTPPVAPTMSTVSPPARSTASMPLTAVMAASGAAPAVATSTLAGLRAIELFSETVTSSAQLPSRTVGSACRRNP